MQYRLNHTAPVDWVMIDPLYTIVVENKHINNYMKAHVEEPVRTRVNLSIVKLLEMISSAVGW